MPKFAEELVRDEQHERNAEGTYKLDEPTDAEIEDLQADAARYVREQHAEDMRRYHEYRADGYSEYQSRLWAGLCDPYED